MRGEEESKKERIECNQKIKLIFIKGPSLLESHKEINIIANNHPQISIILQILTFYNNIYIIVNFLNYNKLILNNYIIHKYLKLIISLKILLRAYMRYTLICMFMAFFFLLHRSRSKWLHFREKL